MTAVSQDKLMPCPFCGSDASIVMGFPGCERCALVRRDVASWNTRPPTDVSTDGLVERLHKMARCIYIAVEASVADDISDGLTKAANRIEALESRNAELEGLRVGDQVECVIDNTDSRWRDDWRGWSGYLAGISCGPSGVYNYTVSEHWPPKNNGDLTDGFTADQLTRKALSHSSETGK